MIEVRDGGLDRPDVAALLAGHLSAMHEHSPPGSVHALDLSELRAPDLSFWTAWDGDTLLGCAALRELSGDHGEVKSMRTAPDQLRRGAASALLRHVIAVAGRRGYRRLSLETGSGPAFEPALALYRRHGFDACPPFAQYRADPFSRFMSLAL